MTAVRMAGLLAERVDGLGMNQRQFANLVGASTKHVNLVFNGKVTAQVRTLDRWAAALNVSFDVQLRSGPA